MDLSPLVIKTSCPSFLSSTSSLEVLDKLDWDYLT